MTLPSWTFSDVMTQVVAFLDQDVIKGLVVVGIALAIIPQIVNTVRSVTGGR
jgi:hypothetical protein